MRHRIAVNTVHPALMGCAVLLLGAVTPAVAHHSGAMFDRTQAVVLEGVVKSFQWTNPHSWIQVEVTDGKGGVKEWSVECGSPNTLARSGWRKNSFQPGDRVKVRVGPMLDGTPAGLFMGAQLASGQTLGEMK